MARVAKELGFTTMSLYRYVTSKDELLQLMWNDSAQGAEELVLEGEDWRARLRLWAIVQREMLDQHPWITQMPMAAPPLAPNSLTFVERGLETLDGTGLADADKLRVIGLISSYTLSEARMANDAARAARPRQATAPGQPAPPGASRRCFVSSSTSRRYPRLHRIAWSAASATAHPASTNRRSSSSASTGSWTASRPSSTAPGPGATDAPAFHDPGQNLLSFRSYRPGKWAGHPVRTASQRMGAVAYLAGPPRPPLPALPEGDDRVAQPQLPRPELVDRLRETGVVRREFVDPLG